MNKNATELFRIMLRQYFLKYYSYLTKDIFYSIMDKIERDYEKSLATPGEPVGLIATQSLMQAIMQATLNTVSFVIHYSLFIIHYSFNNTLFFSH